MNKKIEINIEWFEKLLFLRKKLLDDKDRVKLDWLNYLLGYIDSAESFLETKK